ncbi:MAG: RNA methyltransferase [Tannerellaceae bacterium]|jgi:TrmH family RNA methyltransferase|nr:RNA methyltransferase [Tannerellaceae bacterium]
MLSANKLKYIRSLELKKYRNLHNSFVAEGNKLVAEMLPVLSCKLLVALPEWIESNSPLPAEEVIPANRKEIDKASFLTSPQDVIAIFDIPSRNIESADPSTDLVLLLDGIQDPGNAGTIIRLADWFGITHIICSPDTADAYSPKTIQASMGATARVSIHYASLPNWLSHHSGNTPIYGAFLDGSNIYTHPLSPGGILIMGNEGNGIRSSVAPFVTERLFIPSYPPHRPTSESLNVAIATALACSEFRRRTTSA